MPEKQQYPTEPLTEEQRKKIAGDIAKRQAEEEEEAKKILEKFGKRGLSARVEEEIGQKELAEEANN